VPFARFHRVNCMNLGRYELLAPIAAGGMASVWAARLVGPEGFRKIVAIKSMLPELASDVEYRTMFLDEARVASKLRHPNVCETFELGDDGGTLFLAMEWVDGVSLHRILKPKGAPCAIERAVAARIVAGACAGLHAAHEATDDDGSPLALVHRDVSPQNVLITAAGHVKVSDFGVAAARGQRHATQAGQAKGKLAYMAPEQLRQRPIDRRVDVFALGCVLYEITTGRKPFEGESDAEVLRAILERTPPRPSALVPGYPEELERLIARAMAKDPDQRFASAEGLRIALERWLGGQPRVTERDVAALVDARCRHDLDAIRTKIHAASPRDVVAPRKDALRDSRRGNPTRSRVMALGALVIALGFGSAAWSEAHPAATEALRDAKSEPPPVTRTTTASTTAITTAPATRADSAAATVDPAHVLVRIDPPDARVLLDGEPLELDGEGNATVERPAAGELRVGVVKAPGRVDRIFVVESGTASRIEVALSPEPDGLL
jgi:serine/threonine-protein kinase